MTKKQKKLLQRITAAAVLFAAGMLLPLFAEVPAYIIFALFGISYIIIGWDIIWKAFCNIRQGEAFDENFLMTVATAGAFALGEYSEGVAVMLFYQIGEWFQSYAVSRSRQSITALMDIRPDYANVERNGKLVQVDPDEVAVGEIITVKPGERVPIDGEIISGRSALDTSALTGESLPREVEEGIEVISGCINQTGILKIKTTKEFGESTVAKILPLRASLGDTCQVLSGGMLSSMAAALPPPECVLCHRSDTSLDGCGPMLQVDGVCAHVHCLVSSPRLPAPFPKPLPGTWSPQDCVIPSALLAGCHLLLLRCQHSLPTMVPISLP